MATNIQYTYLFQSYHYNSIKQKINPILIGSHHKTLTQPTIISIQKIKLCLVIALKLSTNLYQFYNIK